MQELNQTVCATDEVTLPEPIVSVVIPAYNREKLLPRAIDSAVGQQIENIEIIVVDDGSADQTVRLIENLSRSDRRIRLERHVRNKGEAAARNTGVKAARGRYIAFLDSDDEWLPGKLKAQLELLQRSPPSVAAAITGQMIVDSDGVASEVCDWTDRFPISGLNLLKLGCGIGMGNTFVVRSDVFARVGYFDENLPLFVDLDWLCRFLEYFEIAKVNQVLIRYYKAPMRKGEFVENAVGKFVKLNDGYLRKYSWLERLRIKSQFYNYISFGYEANGPWRKFVWTRFLHLLLNPVQNPGNYVHFLLASIKLMPVTRRARHG
jgi:glycosyltransferase involved in cell wall biosynthesis